MYWLDEFLSVASATKVSIYDDRGEVEVDLPGRRKEDIDVSLQRGQLVVKAPEHGQRAAFSRAWYVNFPATTEDVSASYVDGVLKVSIRRRASEMGLTRVKVA